MRCRVTDTYTNRQTDRQTDPTTVPLLRIRAEGNEVQDKVFVLYRVEHPNKMYLLE